MYKGIDYGRGKTNIDEYGIRYGVIPHNSVGQVWYDESEPFYDGPYCPKCGDQAIELPNNNIRINNKLISLSEIDQWELKEFECSDYCCPECKFVFGSESAFPEEPYSWIYKFGRYEAECSDEIDIFITKSPYFTYAQFCSPCAPGACYLLSPLKEIDSNNKCYCFGHDWFENEKTPYPVYSVDTGKEVEDG